MMLFKSFFRLMIGLRAFLFGGVSRIVIRAKNLEDILRLQAGAECPEFASCYSACYHFAFADRVMAVCLLSGAFFRCLNARTFVTAWNRRLWVRNSQFRWICWGPYVLKGFGSSVRKNFMIFCRTFLTPNRWNIAKIYYFYLCIQQHIVW